jgi:hypothetical protein
MAGPQCSVAEVRHRACCLNAIRVRLPARFTLPARIPIDRGTDENATPIVAGDRHHRLRGDLSVVLAHCRNAQYSA